MNPFLALLKITFRNYYGISAMRQKYFKEKRELWQPVLAVAGVGVGLSFLLSFCFFLNKGLYAAGKMLGEPALGLELTLIAAGLVIFIFGVSSIIGTLYFTEDSPLLVSLPLKPFQVLAAKFTLVIFNQYLALAFFLVPALLVFGKGEGMGALYIIAAGLVFLLFPVLPLAPAAALSVLVMSTAGSKRLKDLFTVLTYVILIFFALGIQFLMQSLPQGQELTSLETILASHGSLLAAVGKSFPPAVWATRGLALAGTGEGLLNLGLFLVLIGVLIILMLLLGERFFYRGLLAGEEVKRARRERRDSKKLWEAASPFWALVLREHRLFIRTPVYVMNVLPVALIIPVVMVFPLLAQAKLAEIAEIGSYLVQYPYLKLIIVAFTTFFAGTLPLAPSALSREGRLFSLSQAIPVSPGDQIKAKFWYILAINFLCALPFLALVVTVTRLPGPDVPLLALLSLTAAATVTALGILIDLLRPFFDWDNPQHAVKSNLNVLFAMLTTILFLGVLAALSAGLAFRIPWWPGSLTLLVLLGGAAAGLYRGLLLLAEKRYRELEL
ncbi:MAG: hypothetical protein QHH75_12375 [Bacillota bacterium]|nr:hypothetical protein [Bacillota bacterium]